MAAIGWILALVAGAIALVAVQRFAYERQRRLEDAGAQAAAAEKRENRLHDVHAAFVAASIEARELKGTLAERDAFLEWWRQYRAAGVRLKADGYLAEVAKEKHLAEAELDRASGYIPRPQAPPVILVRAVEPKKEVVNG